MGCTRDPSALRGWRSNRNECDTLGFAFAQHVKPGWHSTTAATLGPGEIAVPTQEGGSTSDQAPDTRASVEIASAPTPPNGSAFSCSKQR